MARCLLDYSLVLRVIRAAKGSSWLTGIFVKGSRQD